MKFVDTYFEYKEKYKNYIIICKIGNFYNILGEDTKIVCLMTNYKVNCDKNILKLGFPPVSLERVLRKIGDEKINYMVLEKTDGIIGVKLKRRYSENKYEHFSINVPKHYEYKKRIEDIAVRLHSKIYDKNIKKIIDSIEKLL